MNIVHLQKDELITLLKCELNLTMERKVAGCSF